MSAGVLHKRLLVYIYTTTAAWTCAALIVEGIEVSAGNISVSEHKRYAYVYMITDCSTAGRFYSHRCDSSGDFDHTFCGHDAYDLVDQDAAEQKGILDALASSDTLVCLAKLFLFNKRLIAVA